MEPDKFVFLKSGSPTLPGFELHGSDYNPRAIEGAAENLRAAGVQNTIKADRLHFDRLEPFAGEYLHAAIPHSRATFLPGEGHFFLLKSWETVLAALVGGEQGELG